MKGLIFSPFSFAIIIYFNMKFVRGIICVFLTFSLVFTLFLGRHKITQEKTLSQTSDYRGIITLWHVDTFEGGSGSRKQFLLKIAREFEKKNQGVLIFATSHTVQSVSESINNGVYPDIISYGQGVEIDNLISLPLEASVDGGKIGKETLAVPWCRGGYFLIKNEGYKRKNGEKKTCLVSSSDYTLPVVNLIDKGYDFSLSIKSQYSAYLDFVNNSAEYLLGTQRDIVRLTNRGFNFSSTPLDGYNDLYQYISVISKDNEKVNEAIAFIDFLIGESSQTKLTEINMFSCYYKPIFTSEHMQKMQNFNTFKTISLFNKVEVIKELKELSVSAYEGNVDNLNKLKNFII